MSDADEDDDVEAPGWDAIDAALAEVHGEVEPLHFGTVLKYWMGGPDPVDGISVYAVDAPRPHWHYVTYGFSELYEKETDDPATSGYGFELTFRLARTTDEPPRWPLGLLQNLARYVFQSGNVFGAGHHMDLNGPIAMEDEGTLVRAIAFATDPALPARDTPHGRVEFLQVVGLTLDELAAAQAWNTERFLELLSRAQPLLVTDLSRASALDDPALRADVEARTEAEGSSQAAAFLSGLAWEASGDQARLRVGANGVESLRNMLRGRTPHGRPFDLHGEDARVEVLPGEAAGWAVEDDALRVTLTADVARALRDALAPTRGERRLDALPGLVVEVTPTEIKDRDGNVVRVVG
ncbi:MAG: suppressor of fused domain protein [Planctomycetes bacterium]|nr:suppressor of fused domain protein [Planctomycetota bacterium]